MTNNGGDTAERLDDDATGRRETPFIDREARIEKERGTPNHA
jgi:hypothetical protein